MRQKLELELELQRFREALRAEKDRYAAIDALGLESELREQNPILKQAKSGGAWCVVLLICCPAAFQTHRQPLWPGAIGWSQT